MAVDLDEAIRRAVKAFYENSDFEEYEKISGKKSKYSGGMFDEYEKKLRKSMKKNKGREEVKINPDEADEIEEELE